MKNWVKVFLFFLVSGLLVYFNSLNNKFLIDDYVFLNNPISSDTKFILSQWNPFREEALGILDIHESLKYYRPMTQIVYDLSYAAFKDHYWQYHALNLLLLVFAAFLIYLLIERVTKNFDLAFLAGFFYLIHPINGIVVNYISASVFTLQVICMLATILLLWESLERKNDRVLYFLSLLFSFLSLFWHESGIMTPVYVLAFILLFKKDPFKTKIGYLLPYFLIVLAYLIFRSSLLGTKVNLLNNIAHFHMTAGQYLAGLFQVLSWYIVKLFYPQGIVMQWAAPTVHGRVFLNVLGLFLLLMFFILLFIRFAKSKILQLAVTWVLIGFAPVLLAAYIRSINGAVIEPHWFIFSSIGFFILAASFCLFVLGRTKKVGLALLFIVIFGWGSVSHAYNRLWADQKTYALYWAHQVPYFQSTYFYIADAYYKEGSFKEARKYYKLALAGVFSDLEIYNNLGVMDEQDGNWKGAESNYRKALKIHPFSARTYHNLGKLYYKQGQYDRAKKSFDRSLMLNPLLTESRRGLALISLRHGEYQKAIDLCLKNLNFIHDDKDSLLLLVDIFIQEKDTVDLKRYAYRVISLETDPGALTQLGIDMAQNNVPAIALDCFEKAIKLDPGHMDTYLAAGTMFMNLGKYDEAIHIWTSASSIDPSDKRFKNDIVKAKALRSK